jgi:hypothetical protein
LIEQRIWTKPSFSMECIRVNQLPAQSASCKFFSTISSWIRDLCNGG